MAEITLADMLKKKKLSKRQFAKLINMRYEQVFRLFRVGYDPKLSSLALWAKALRCRIKDLYRE
jgi:transcriptional regulator with XRE-family HTH domain